MTIEFNGTTITTYSHTVNANSTSIDKVILDGTTVWETFVVADNIIDRSAGAVTSFIDPRHTFVSDGSMLIKGGGVLIDTANGSWGLPAATGAASAYEIQCDEIGLTTTDFFVNGINVGFGAYFDMTGGAWAEKTSGSLLDTVRVRIRTKVGSIVVFDTQSISNLTLDR